MFFEVKLNMQLTTVVLGISCFSCVLADTAILSLPTSANCGDSTNLMCKSTSCNTTYKFLRNGLTIYNQAGPQNGSDSARYSATVTSYKQVQLTIASIQLSDVGAYTCACGFDAISTKKTIQYECMETTSITEISSAKKLSIIVNKLYPQPSGTSGIITTLTAPTTSQLSGMYTCGSSIMFASHYMCTWVSTASIPDGNYKYSIKVTTETQRAPVTGSFRIVTVVSPIISNLVTISNNRQVLLGKQDTLLSIQCVSMGGIPAPTLAWYRGNMSTSPLAQSSVSDIEQKSDGTYTVNLSYNFTSSRADDMTPFLCRVFYPGATTGATPDPSPALARLFLDLKPNITIASQSGEAISGGKITLRCTATNGRPAPNITWSYQGQTFAATNASRHDPISETYTVEFILQRPVSAVDNKQTATCIVSHTTLSAPLTRTFNVDVKFGPRPYTTTISGNKTIPATGTNQIQLNCTSGSSNPASNITWYNGSEVIPNTEGYTRWPGNNSGVITSNILTITPTRYMDGDRVTCSPDNGYGNDSSYVVLDILYSSLIKTLPNVTAIEGEPKVTLTCSASSKPPATFTWYKGNVVVASSMGTDTDNSFSHVIHRVDRTDDGSYTCRANNSVGSPDSRDAYLIVKYPPTVNVSATTSPSYTITCTADGYPNNYTFRDWVQVWPGFGHVATIPFTGTSITLTNDTYERSGVYVCAASNGVAVYGTDVKYLQGNVTILIKAPPVLTDQFPVGKRVHVAGRLGQNATTKIKYWSNVDGSVVKCYKLVNGSRSSSSSCSVTETGTKIKLSVYNHMVTETGTLATINILITNDNDLTDYDLVVSNSVQGESVLGITIAPEDISTAHEETKTGLIAGIATGICIPLLIGVIVLIMCRWKRACGNHSKANERRNLANANSDIVECAMYVSAGHIQPGAIEGDLYSKQKKEDQTTAALYAVAIKPKKEPTKPSTQGGESVYEYPDATASVGPSMSKQKNINNDGLIYADLEFNKKPKKSVIHGLDDATTYVQVDFTKTADALPDSDEETVPEK